MPLPSGTTLAIDHYYHPQCFRFFPPLASYAYQVKNTRLPVDAESQKKRPTWLIPSPVSEATPAFML